VPVPADVKVKTKNVDAELALQAGPQLVVPITNARYALNAANARWGSLYDALYGTDALPETDGATRTVDGKPGYNPVRGAKVIEYARHVLDRTAPLAKASHLDATGYAIVDGALAVTLKNGKTAGLKKAKQLVGWQGDAARRPACCCSTTACTWTSASTATRPSAPATPPAWPTWCSNRRCRPSSTWKTRWPWSTPTTRCWPTATGWASCRAR
jgi:malate synthase